VDAGRKLYRYADGVYKSKAAFNRWKNDPDNALWALSRDVKLINKGKTK
jgi:hypothetical protein